MTTDPGAIENAGRAVDTRTDVINYLIERNGYRRYLEIGVRTPSKNFDHVRAKTKHGVDPDPRGKVSHRMTSDEFFTQFDPNAPPYDLVFVDGLHLEDQVYRDVMNALDHLAPGGAVVMHDCNPPEESNQVEEYDGHSSWNGTAWKAYARLRMTRTDLALCVVDIDWGVGIVAEGRQDLYPKQESIDYALLERDRVGLLNLLQPAGLPRFAASTFGPPASGGSRSILDRMGRRRRTPGRAAQ